MKKILIIFVSVFLGSLIFAQSKNTVDLQDEIYNVLSACETKALCNSLSDERPYTKEYILKVLNEIAENLKENNSYSSKVELETIEEYIKAYEIKSGFSLKDFRYHSESEKDGLYTSFNFDISSNTFVSSGIYEDSETNSTGYESINTISLFGDLGKNTSYRFDGSAILVSMPLTQMGNGDYYIGNWWSSTDFQESKTSVEGTDISKSPRYIKSFKNYAMNPYKFYKYWDGSTYAFENISATGLNGWPVGGSLGMSAIAELHSSFYNNRIELGIGRYYREWLAMDNGSSLVLNSSARPFFGIDASFKISDWFSLATLTGFLEFPNQAHINSNAWYLMDSDGAKVTKASPGITDSYFFQDMISLTVLNFDFKYFHGDFGSSVIYPKRFDLAYAFPLLENVMQQNNMGDFDNLCMFADFKGILPGIGSAWFSVFIDEYSNFTDKFWEKSRFMYAFQLGSKVNLPFLPFGKLSFRYTKIEPYCYTHTAVKYQPYYDYYVASSYTNNGSSLGYYLDPNSDEIYLRIDAIPMKNLNCGLQYQLIRHGATWGSGQVEGSSLYSELEPRSAARDNHSKYFLHDGVYEWTNLVSFDAQYNFRNLLFPFTIYGSFSYIYDWFTASGSKNSPKDFYFIDTNEYPDTNGVILSLGIKIFY